MARTVAAEEGQILSTLRDEIEDAIDEARSLSLRPLSLVVVRLALSRNRRFSVAELNMVRDEVMFAVGKQLGTGATTPTVANQLGRVVENKVRDLQRAASVERKHFEPGDNTKLLEEIVARDEVHGEVADREACERIMLALEELRQTNRRYYEAIRAHIDGLSVSRHLTHLFGEPVTEDTSRKVLQRARERFSGILAARAEEAS